MTLKCDFSCNGYRTATRRRTGARRTYCGFTLGAIRVRDTLPGARALRDTVEYLDGIR